MKLKIFAAFTAACVMAVGLYGQAEEAVTLLGEDYFLSYTNNSTIADMSAYLIENEGALEVEETMAVGLWSAGEADMSKVINNENVNCLNLDTAGDVVTNSLYANGELNDSITAKGKAVITAEMLMVPSDEIESSFVDAYAPISPEWGIVDNGDLKFGLYAYEYDVTKTVTEGETTEEVVEVVTNLVIYHSYYDTPYELEGGDLATPVGYTNYVYEVPSNTDFTQPQAIKITLMQAKTEELFFKVTLNDIDVVTPYGCAEATIVNCPDELPYRDGGPWLRCVNNGNVNSISAINFSGTGTINGLTAGTIDANGGGGGEGGDDTEIVLSWNEFAGFADTTVGETATTNVTFNLANANEATVTIEGDSAFAIADQSTLGTVTVTFAPTEAKVYNATLTVTAGDKSATLSITGTGVAAGEPALTYPDDSAITDTALLAWLTGKNATQAQIDALGTVEALNEKYLLNLDLENSSYTLKIKSLAVGDDVKVEVELTRLNGETAVEAAINGKLQLWGTTDLGVDFEDCGLTEITNADFSTGTTAVKSFTPATGVKFFKAVIVNPTAAE